MITIGINYNGTVIEAVTHNADGIDLVTYNGAEVWQNTQLVNYVFPNENAKITSNSNSAFGITVYASLANVEMWKAYDSDYESEYRYGYGLTSSTAPKIGITFPFPIRLKSITITNAKKNIWVGVSTYVGALLKGTIYVSPDVKTSSFTDGDVYAEIDRSTAKTGGEFTTHSNENYNEWIQSICINDTSWANSTGGTNKYYHRMIGEISLEFEAKSTDLAAAGLL